MLYALAYMWNLKKSLTEPKKTVPARGRCRWVEGKKWGNVVQGTQTFSYKMNTFLYLIYSIVIKVNNTVL